RRSENAVAIGVKSARTTVSFDITPQNLHVVERAFVLDHLKLHQLASGVVDENDNASFAPALLEPSMVGSVDLYQFATLRARFAQLEDARLFFLPGLPDSFLDHPVPQCSDADTNSMPFLQLL